MFNGVQFSMIKLNDLYLLEVSKQFQIDKMNLLQEPFSSYRITKNNKNACYLLLCNDEDLIKLNQFLNIVSLWEKTYKINGSFLCIIPNQNASIDMCTYSNGTSFVHFIFVDNINKILIYDDKFHYWGSKKIKFLIKLYRTMFYQSRYGYSVSDNPNN